MTYGAPTKAVILARGLGSRMRKAADDVTLSAEQAQAADSGVKAMISVGRPFLDHVISALADAGFTDVCLVIGPEHDMIRDYYDTLPRTRVTIAYAVQVEPLGTANAVLAAEDFAGDDRVLVINSDNYYPAAVVSMNCWLCGPAIFDAARSIPKSARGEYEITDAVRAAIASGDPYAVVVSDEGVLDMSARGDIASVAAALGDREIVL